jgi:hypothetical protein
MDSISNVNNINQYDGKTVYLRNPKFLIGTSKFSSIEPGFR